MVVTWWIVAFAQCFLVDLLLTLTFQGLIAVDEKQQTLEHWPIPGCCLSRISSVKYILCKVNVQIVVSALRGYFMVTSGGQDLMDSSWGLAKKHTSERSEQVRSFSKALTREHQILSSINYHEVTHFSHKQFSISPITAASLSSAMNACTIDCASTFSKSGGRVQLIRHFTVYVIVISLCQTFHKDTQSESRLMNKAVLRVEFKFWHHSFFIHKINVECNGLIYLLQLFLVPSGTHCYLVGRCKIMWEVCLPLLYMAGGENWTQDPYAKAQILNQ